MVSRGIIQTLPSRMEKSSKSTVGIEARDWKF